MLRYLIFAAGGALALGACASFRAEPTPSSLPEAADASADADFSEGGAPPDLGPAGVCPQGVIADFCDFFDQSSRVGPSWGSETPGSITIDSTTFNSAPHSLRVKSPVAGGVSYLSFLPLPSPTNLVVSVKVDASRSSFSGDVDVLSMLTSTDTISIVLRDAKTWILEDAPKANPNREKELGTRARGWAAVELSVNLSTRIAKARVDGAAWTEVMLDSAPANITEVKLGLVYVPSASTTVDVGFDDFVLDSQ